MRWWAEAAGTKPAARRMEEARGRRRRDRGLCGRRKNALWDLCVVVSPVTAIERGGDRERVSKGRQRARGGERRRKTVKDKKDGVKCIQKNGSQTKKPRC